MASIYESAQRNYLRSREGGRITQSQHDAARRYANANNMDYDPNKGYGAKGSFDTKKIPKSKVRDPAKGEFKGGAMGLAGIGAALGLDKMTPSQAQAEITRRFGGGPSQLADGTPNPYKRYDNVPEEIRQMQIRRYEESRRSQPMQIYNSSMGDVTINGKKYNPLEASQIQGIHSKYAGGEVLGGDEISKAKSAGFFDQDRYSQVLGRSGYQLGANNTATYNPELYAQNQFQQSLIGDREQTEFDRLSRQHQFHKSMAVNKQQEDLAKQYQQPNLQMMGTSPSLASPASIASTSNISAKLMGGGNTTNPYPSVPSPASTVLPSFGGMTI